MNRFAEAIVTLKEQFEASSRQLEVALGERPETKDSPLNFSENRDVKGEKDLADSIVTYVRIAP
jgi:hypothetical protein